MSTPFLINPDEGLHIAALAGTMRSGQSIALSSEAQKRIVRCRQYLDQRLAGGHEAIYGINTGFGALCNTVIAPAELGALQRNLLVSHACGTGAEVAPEIVRLMLLLKVQALSHGHSGVQLDTVQRLVDFFNQDIVPVVYEHGSLGASGDLAPLAHLVLPLIGEGEVYLRGQRMAAAAMHSLLGWSPLELSSKEGLALINGTQFMCAYGLHITMRMRHLWEHALHIAALSADAFDARPEPFDELTHRVRRHSGQPNVAGKLRELLHGSAIQQQTKSHVQDPYSFRCIPQVLGASLEAFNYVDKVLEREMNSVTDNPLIFPEEDRIISGGNFHGQPLALALDFLAIALAEVGSMAERRTYKLISGQRGLPPFLATNAGLHSGFMIPQYTAAALVSQNKQLCTPASVDTIDSSNGQEDHVSMGANAATRCLRVLDNVQMLLAIELLTAAQALDFRKPLKSSPALEDYHARFRQVVPFLKADAYLHPLMEKAKAWLGSEAASV